MIQGAPRQLFLVVVAVIGVAFAACSGAAPPSSTCPNDYPTSCPDASPSFAAEVGPLIHTHCTICHGSGQQVPTLQSHAEIMLVGPRIFNQVHACLMPPSTRPPLTTEERQALLTWLVCGAMDN